PVQVIDPPAPVSPDLVDRSGHAAQVQPKLLRDLIDVESVRPFALAAGPLLRTWLIRLAAPPVANRAEHVLLVVAHHAIIDGWSARLLLRDLAALYAAEVTGEPSGLDELPVQFADYAAWERARLRGPVLAELAAWWRGYVPLDPALPPDRLAFMITHTAMPVILTDPASTTSIPAARPGLVGVLLATPEGYQQDTHEPVTLVDLDAEQGRIAALDDTDLTSPATPGNVACVIYTSGSTGRPKGVVAEHRHLVNLLHGMITQWDIGPSDAVLQFASLSFDASVQDMFMPLDPGTQLPPPIGRPVRPSYQAYELDPHLNPVPVGVTGELHLGGASVARGYLNRPELTRERFIPDPFRPGQRLYKTGDLVRRRPDGTIVFLGRADGQVKIRGLRIELGEIESALATHPAIAQAVVTVATRLVPVTEFPLNTSGKINKGALPAPGDSISGPSAGTGPAAAAGPVATLLAGLFATVLRRDRVGPDDSFFDLGGSCLAVMRLVDLIAGRLGADVGVAAIFLHPTPR
ncbi:MAG: AMP-binding protein, partial [Streptosporangiaceae bacterium]